MAGYSGSPLPKKLGIKPACRVLLVNTPDGIEEALSPLPEGANLLRQPEEIALFDVIVLFVRSRAELLEQLPVVVPLFEWTGGLWIAWPKKASRVPSDLTEDMLREVILPLGLVDNKVCAVDETWSGLRFVHRRELRPKAVKK